MANQTYVELQREISRLRDEAEAIRAAEVAGVVAKIKDAITVYELTPQDLFGRAATSGTGSRASADAGPSTSTKYLDGQGGTWGGRGPRPLWLREAIASGRSLEDFEIGASGASGVDTTSESLATVQDDLEQPTKKAVKVSRASYRDPATGKV